MNRTEVNHFAIIVVGDELELHLGPRPLNDRMFHAERRIASLAIAHRPIAKVERDLSALVARLDRVAAHASDEVKGGAVRHSHPGATHHCPRFNRALFRFDIAFTFAVVSASFELARATISVAPSAFAPLVRL